MKKLAIVSLLALAGAAAQAQNIYGDIAYQMHDTDLTTDPATLRATLGYEFNSQLAGEVMFGISARDGEQSGVTAKLDHLFGIYAKPKVKLNDSFELYGRLGYVSSKVSASAGGSSISGSSSGLSYGIGASYYINPSLSLNVDYMDFDDLEGGVAFGVKYTF